MSHDIAVIGGGPAGLSAAINARVRNKTVLVVGNDYRESPLYRAERVDNYLGMPGLTGAQLLDAYQRHAEDMGVEFRHGRVLNIMPMEHTCYLSIGTVWRRRGGHSGHRASRGGRSSPARPGVSGPGRELLRDL